jgi:hypothetical protein
LKRKDKRNAKRAELKAIKGARGANISVLREGDKYNNGGVGKRKICFSDPYIDHCPLFRRF